MAMFADRGSSVGALLLGVVLAAAVIGDALGADNQGQPLTISGTQDNTCTLGAFTVGASDNASYDTVTDTLTITDPGGDDAIADSFSISLTAPAMCNFTHQVKLQTTNGGLTNAATATGFANHINYSGLTLFGTAIVNLLTDGTASASAQSTPKTAAVGSLQLIIANGALPTQPLIAGTYADTLTLTIGSI